MFSVNIYLHGDLIDSHRFDTRNDAINFFNHKIEGSIRSGFKYEIRQGNIVLYDCEVD